MFIIKHKWIFLTISIILVAGSLLLVAIKGIKKGIDFTGGTEIVVAYKGYTSTKDSQIDLNYIKENIINNGFDVKSVSLQKVDTQGVNYVLIRLPGEVKEEERFNFENAWSFNHDKHYEASQISENVIGPSIGKELTRKAIWAIILVVIVIVIFIAFSFREVSKPVSSWKYGLLTVGTLIHDITIPLGMYAILGITHGAEIDSLFVLALLTIMGISMADTIVVFDRVRENLKNKKSNEAFYEVVGKSLNQTLLRSFNTSLAVLLVLFALYFFGPVSIRDFSLTLIVGMTFGTYSSIFIASPLLVLVEKWQKKN